MNSEDAIESMLFHESLRSETSSYDNISLHAVNSDAQANLKKT